MKLLDVRYLGLYIVLGVSSCDAPFSGDAVATLKSPVLSALNSPSSEGNSQLRADSLALGTTIIQELQEDLVAGGMDLVQANAITTSATKSMKAGTLAIGLHLAEDDQTVVITKAIDVASLIVKGAVGGLNSPDAALSDLTLRSSFTSKILDSSIDSVTAPGRSSSDDLATLAQTMVGQAVSSLDDAGFGDDAASGAAAVTQGAMQSLGRQSSLDTSVLVSVAQSVATGAVAAIGNAGVSSDKLGDVAKSLTLGAVSALSSSSGVDDAKMAQMVKGIAKGAVKGISSSTQDDTAKAALASSVTEGAVGGLSQSSGRELSSITKAVTEGAVSGIKDVGSSDFSGVAQSIAAGAMTGLSSVGGDAASVSSLASSVAAGAIGGLKDAGISDAEAAQAAGGCVQGSIAGLSQLDLKDANGSSSSNLTEAIGLVTEGAMSSLSAIAPSGDTTLATAMASASMAGLSTLKSGFDANSGGETVDLAGAASRVAQGAVKALEAQNDGSIDLGSQLQAVTGGMVGSMKTAGFSESDLSSGAGAIAAGAVKGFENDSSASYVSNVMAGTMGNLDNAGMSDADIALAMSDIVGKTMEAVGERSVAKGSTASSSSTMIQSIVSGAVQGLDGAEMSDSTAVQSAVQGIARGATSGLKKAGVAASDMSTVASAVTKTSIQQLSQVKVSGAQIDARNIQAMASKVARGSMEGFTTASQEFATAGESVASLNDFAGELSKGALDALKDINNSGTTVDFGTASSDLAGAILEGAAQNEGGLGDLETQLNTSIRENVSSELSTAELDKLTTEISQKADEAASLSTALAGGSFSSCQGVYGDGMSDENFYQLLPSDNSILLCEKQSGALCPKAREKDHVSVNWYPLATKENICELEFFSHTTVDLGDFNFSALPTTVTDSVLKLSWSASANANFYGFKIAYDEGCQNSVHEEDNLPSTQLSVDYNLPDAAANGLWYVCLGSRTDSFQFKYSTPPSRSFTLNRATGTTDTTDNSTPTTTHLEWISESQDKGPAYYFRYTNDEGESANFATFAKPISVELVNISGGNLHALSAANQYTPENLNPGDSLGDNVYWRWTPDSSHTKGQEYDVFDYKVTDANGDVFNLTARVYMSSTDGDDSLSETNSPDEQFFGGFGGDTIVGTSQSDEILADSEPRVGSLYSHDSSLSDPAGWYVADKGGPSDQDSYPNWHSMTEGGTTLTRSSGISLDSSGRGAVVFSGTSDPGFDGYFSSQLQGGFTLAVLAKVQAHDGVLFSAGDSSDLVGLKVTSDGRVRVISTLFTGADVLESPQIADGNFHMFVLKVGDDGRQTLYVDGVEGLSAAGALFTNTSTVRVGHGFQASTGTNASISEVVFYNEALDVIGIENLERYLAYRGGIEIRDLTFGADTLTGGSGADVFSWSDMSYSVGSQTDTITDFNPSEGDRIDFRGIGDVFLDLEPGTTMGGERGQVIAEVTGSDTFVKLDYQGDGAVDFEIRLQGYTGGLVPSNFLLPVPGHNSGVQWEDFFQASRYNRGYDGETTSGGNPSITTWSSVPHSFSEGESRGAFLSGFTQDGEGWRNDGLHGKSLSFKGQSFVSLPDLEANSFGSGISFVILAQMEPGTPPQDRVLFSYRGKTNSSRKIELIQKTDNDVVLDLGVTTKSLGYQFGGEPLLYSISISSGMLNVYVNGVAVVESSYDASGWSVDDTMEGRLGQTMSGTGDFHGHIALYGVGGSSLYQSTQKSLFNEIANLYRTHPVGELEGSGLIVYLDAANNRRIGFADMTGVTSCSGFPSWADLANNSSAAVTGVTTCDANNDSWLGSGLATDPYRLKLKDGSMNHTVQSMTAQKITLEAWVKVSSGTSGCSLVKWEDSMISGRFYELSLGGVGEIKISSDTFPFQTSNDIDDDNWHHIVLSANLPTGGLAKLYLDGVNVGSAVMSGGGLSSGADSFLKIGKFAGGCSAEYGMVRLYNSLPSDADVLEQCQEKEAEFQGASCGP